MMTSFAKYGEVELVGCGLVAPSEILKEQKANALLQFDMQLNFLLSPNFSRLLLVVFCGFALFFCPFFKKYSKHVYLL